MSLRTVSILLVVSLVALGISIYWNFDSSASANSHLVKGIGAGCADETLRVAGTGEVVLVVTGDDDSRVGSFRKALKKHPQIRLTAHIVTPNPQDTFPLFPLGELRDVLQKHRTAAAIFFMVELPPWEMVQIYFTEPTGPKLLALAQGLTLRDHGGYFLQGRLAALITTRQTQDAAVPTNPKTPQEWFAHDYEIVTPENYTTRLPNPTYGTQ